MLQWNYLEWSWLPDPAGQIISECGCSYNLIVKTLAKGLVVIGKYVFGILFLSVTATTLLTFISCSFMDDLVHEMVHHSVTSIIDVFHFGNVN